MRKLKKGAALHVRAIGGLWVVTLAWDFAAGEDARRDGLLGFGIEREELVGGAVIERYFLRGIKRFKGKDEGLAPGTPVPTSEHPIQSFQWGDYTAKPATTYRYRVVPMYGKPKLLEPDDDAATTVEITTEPELGRADANGGVVHDIYFNRGVAGSQAYARRFGLDKPDPDARIRTDALAVARTIRSVDRIHRSRIGRGCRGLRAARHVLRIPLRSGRKSVFGRA